MNTRARTDQLLVILDVDTFIEFKSACDRNHISPNEVIARYCEEYAKIYGESDIADQLVKKERESIH